MYMRHLMLLLIVLLLLPPSIFARSYGASICHSPGFVCQRVKRGQSWERLWPDAHERSIVMRINRMNVSLYPGITLAVPINLATANIMDYAPFPKQIQPPGEKLVVIDPSVFAWAAYQPDGSLLRWGPASSGADFCEDVDSACRTHEGTFRIFSLGSSDCYSTKFPLPDGGAPMPYCMYFNNGQALHGEPHGLPGYNASHGCVRMYVNDAEWLRYDFIESPNENNRFRGTLVVVRGYGYDTPYREDNTDRDEQNIGYDQYTGLDSSY